VRTRFYLPSIIFLLFALSVGIYSQQTGSARRQPANPTDPITSTAKPSSRARVTAPVVKSDLSEALSVIEENYIDGKKLEYNSIFKS
jgi:hypothetical protein